MTNSGHSYIIGLTDKQGNMTHPRELSREQDQISYLNLCSLLPYIRQTQSLLLYSHISIVIYSAVHLAVVDLLQTIRHTMTLVRPPTIKLNWLNTFHSFYKHQFDGLVIEHFTKTD